MAETTVCEKIKSIGKKIILVLGSLSTIVLGIIAVIFFSKNSHKGEKKSQEIENLEKERIKDEKIILDSTIDDYRKDGTRK